MNDQCSAKEVFNRDGKAFGVFAGSTSALETSDWISIVAAERTKLFKD
jgi:hypothetical protein